MIFGENENLSSTKTLLYLIHTFLYIFKSYPTTANLEFSKWQPYFLFHN
jgi:hypothetical protein